MKLNIISSEAPDTKEHEKGFVFGASEDGTIYYRKNKNEYGLEIEQKYEDWLEIVQEALLAGFQKQSRIRKRGNGYFRLVVYSKKLYKELKDFRGKPRILLRKPKKFQIGFLQGFFDAEGSIKRDRKHVTSSSKREDLIEVVRLLLERFGIKCGKTWKDRNGVITLPFYGRENLERFSETINFRHVIKRRRLNSLI